MCVHDDYYVCVWDVITGHGAQTPKHIYTHIYPHKHEQEAGVHQAAGVQLAGQAEGAGGRRGARDAGCAPQSRGKGWMFLFNYMD